jgi:hypothetical protein
MKSRIVKLQIAFLIAITAPAASRAATISWTNTSGGNWSVAANWNPHQVPGLFDNAVITVNGSYAVTLDTSPTINSLTLGGTSGQQTLTNNSFTLTLSSASTIGTNAVFALTGGAVKGQLNCKGAFDWSGGQISPGSLTIASNAVMNINSGLFGVALYGVLTNAGTVNWSGIGALQLNNNSLLGYYGGIVNEAGAVFNAQSDLEISGTYGTEYFNNAGTFVKSPTMGTTTLDVLFTNTGTVEVETGTILFDAKGAGNGTFNAAAGTDITFANNNSGTAFGGAGTYMIAAGTVTLTGSGGNVVLSGGTLNGVNSISNLTFNSGTMAGTDVVTTVANWTGGSLTGALAIASNAVLNVSSLLGLTLYGVLTNAGTVNWSGLGDLQLYNDPALGYFGGIVNEAGAVFNAQSDSLINTSYGSEYFDNLGTFIKSPTLGITTIDVLFTNAGTVEVETGSILFDGGGSGNGVFDSANGTEFIFGNNISFGNTNSGAAFNGTGIFNITGGVVTLAGDAENVVLSGGTLNGVSGVMSNLTWSGGTLAGTNLVTGLVNWTAGSLTGALTIASNSVLNISNNVSPVTLYGVLTNAGTVNWLGTAGIQMYNNSLLGYFGGIANLPGAVFNAQNDATVGGLLQSGYFNNAGTLLKSAGTASTINILFTNVGVVEAEAGTINLDGGVNLATGTLTFGITNQATNGNVAVSGAAGLKGTLAATFNDGFVPSVSNSWHVLTYGSSSGSFASTNLPTNAVWQIIQGATGVRIKVLKLIPQLAWTAPAPIVYGTALTSAQLAANAIWNGSNVPGLFTYSPPLNTVLQSGSNQVLSVSFVPTDLTTYTNVTVTVPITVLQASLSITASNLAKTYGQVLDFAGTEFAASGLVNGDTLSGASLASSGAAGTATVGGSPYAITVSNAVGNAGLSNYIISYIDGSLTVNPAPLTITATAQGKTYGASLAFGSGSTAFNSSPLFNSDNISSVTLACSGGTATAGVGGYTITPSAALGNGLANYLINYATGTLTVNPAALTITANSTSKTYGQTLSFAGTEFMATGLLNSDLASSVTLNSSGAAATASVPGSPYAIIPSSVLGSGLSNYIINYENGAMTVTPAALTITASNTNKTYGQTVTLPGTNFTPTGLQNSETVGAVTLACAGAAASATVAGSPYSIVPSAATNGTFAAANYIISYVDGTLTVNPAGLTIAANNTNKTYGQMVTFAGTEFTPLGLLNGDSATSVTLTSSGAGPLAGVVGSPYTIIPGSVVGSGLANYTISYVNGALTVNPAPLTVTANNTNKTYGQSLTFAGTEFIVTGLQNAESVEAVTLTSAGASTNAGVASSPYNIIPSSATNGTFSPANYAISYLDGTLTVNPAALTIAANDTNKTYGETLSFLGTEFTPAGLQNAETIGSVTLSCLGTGSTATVAGSPYSIVPSAATNGTFLPTNYIISYTNGTLTVNPAALIITALNTNKAYGQTVNFAGNEFTATGLLNSDSATSVSLISRGTPATASVAGSPYAIVPSGALGSGLGNYIISYVDGVLTVSPTSLIITANNQSKTYGQTVTFAGTEFTATGLLNGDSATSVSLTSGGAAPTSGVAGSPYAIIPGSVVGSGLDNYAIGYVNGSLTVHAAALTITANSTNKTYGQTTAFGGTEFTSIGLQNSESVGSVTLTSAGASTNAGVAGSPYNIIPSSATNGTFSPANYAISYLDGTLTVNPAALTIAANDTNKTYGETLTFLGTDFTPAGLQNAETIGSVTLSCLGTGATATVAGSPYSIVPSAATNGTFLHTNYIINYTNGTLTVNPAALIITANGTNKAYGQKVTFSGTEFVPTGLLNSDMATNITLTSLGAAPTASVLGSPYSIIPSAALGNGLGNYTIAYVNGTLTINAAPLTITANNQSKNYGQAVTFAGTEFTATGLLNGDSASSVTLTSGGAAPTSGVAGSPYAIIPSSALGSGLANYAISYVNGVMTVNPALLQITANNTNKTYGQALIFAGTEFTSAGLQNSETVGSVTLTSAGSTTNASVEGSPYSIIPSAATNGTFAPANYILSYASGILTVNPAPLLIAANDTNKVYGQVLTFAGTEFTATGLQNLETVGSVTLNCVGAAANATVAGSPYSIVPSAATNGTFLPTNYTILYTNGTLTVSPAALTIAPNNTNKIYGQTVTFAGTESTSLGLLNGDTATNVSLTCPGATPVASVLGSPYPIIPSSVLGSGLGNYTIGYVNGTLNVTAAPLLITANDTNKFFGQTLTFLGTEFSSLGLQNGETVGAVTLSSSGVTASAPIGTYPIISSLATGGTFTSNNYVITYHNGILTVNAPPTLQYSLQGGVLVLSWPASAIGFSLQTATNLSIPSNWTPVTNTVTVIGDQNVVTNATSEAWAFFDLKSQ